MQQRVRGALGLWQGWAVGAIERGKHRISPARRGPALRDGVGRKRHGVSRLVARHARPAIDADRREERMPRGVDRSTAQQRAHDAGGVGIVEFAGEWLGLAGRPPRCRSSCVRRHWLLCGGAGQRGHGKRRKQDQRVLRHHSFYLPELPATTKRRLAVTSRNFSVRSPGGGIAAYWNSNYAPGCRPSAVRHR